MLVRELLSLPASRKSALSLSPAKAPEIEPIVSLKRSGIYSEHGETYCAAAAINDRISGTNAYCAHASTEGGAETVRKQLAATPDKIARLLPGNNV
jgi:hypothetical protein